MRGAHLFVPWTKPAVSSFVAPNRPPTDVGRSEIGPVLRAARPKPALHSLAEAPTSALA